MHLCYALTSNGDDSYARLAYISAVAARMVHPKITISAVVDELSAEALQNRKAKILDVVDHLVTIPTGQQDAKLRSRILKTRSREFIQGDYVQIDVDAIPVAPLDEIFTYDCDIAAALDRNDPPEKYQLAGWVTDVYKQLGWTWDKPRYYNSGVLLFRDTPQAHRFAAEWYQRWQQTTAVGKSDDQPSFNSAVVEVKPRITIIPDRYNLLVDGIKCPDTSDAAIVHLYALGRSKLNAYIVEELMQSLKDNQTMDESLLREMIRKRYVWSDPYFVKAHWQARNLPGLAKSVVVKLKRKVLG